MIKTKKTCYLSPCHDVSAIFTIWKENKFDRYTRMATDFFFITTDLKICNFSIISHFEYQAWLNMMLDQFEKICARMSVFLDLLFQISGVRSVN